MTQSSITVDIGFYGKLPVYGDFIHRRLPRSFMQPWDQWLQQGLAAAKERLPREWLTYYLNCPAWSFVLGDGVCGEAPCAGVTIPSVDKVGRYFNFTLVGLLPAGTEPARFFLENDQWLARLETLALDVLGDELDQDQIDQRLFDLPSPSAVKSDSGTMETGNGWLRMKLREPGEFSHRVSGLLHALISEPLGRRYGLWTQTGSNQVPAQLLCTEHMPNAKLFLDMLISHDATDPEVAGDPILEEFLNR